MREASTSLFIFPACHGPQALVLRRGPSKWWHFLLWDRDTGELKPGSWFCGTIYPERCDLSPRGDWMVILAYRGVRKPHAWTALCHAPNVHAHTFWPQENAAVGGGFFDERLPILWVNLPDRSVEAEHHEPQPLDFGYQDEEAPYYGSSQERLQRDGWRLQKGKKKGEPATWRQQSPVANLWLWLSFDGTVDELDEDGSLLYGDRVQYSVSKLKSGEEAVLLEGCTWAGWNGEGRLCFVKGGSIYDAEPLDLVRARLVADLTNLKPPANRMEPRGTETQVADR